MFVNVIIENLHLFLLCTRNDINYSRKVLENSLKSKKDTTLEYNIVKLSTEIYLHLFICTTLIFLNQLISTYFGNFNNYLFYYLKTDIKLNFYLCRIRNDVVCPFCIVRN